MPPAPCSLRRSGARRSPPGRGSGWPSRNRPPVRRTRRSRPWRATRSRRRGRPRSAASARARQRAGGLGSRDGSEPWSRRCPPCAAGRVRRAGSERSPRRGGADAGPAVDVLSRARAAWVEDTTSERPPRAIGSGEVPHQAVAGSAGMRVSNTSADRQSDAATSPMASPDACSPSAGSEPDFCQDCGWKGVRKEYLKTFSVDDLGMRDMACAYHPESRWSVFE